jgi:carbamoyl-phosphate synthase large subunit
MSHAANVLVTCGGKWVGMLLQLKQAMREVPPLRQGKILVADRAPITPAGHFADGAFVVPPITEPDYVDALVDVCRQQGVRVLVPLIDVDMIRLTPHASRFAEVGTRLACPLAELVDLCFDKASFEAFARVERIPTPRQYAPQELDAAAYPLFFKPSRGFGSVGSGLCRSPREAREALQANPTLVFQEYLQGAEVSVDCYIAATGRCTVRVQRIRDKVVGGEAVQTHTVHLDGVRQVVARTVDALARRGLRGPLNVQVFASGETPVFDVNPRLGSASVLSNVATRGRLMRSLLSECCGLAVDGDPEDYQEGLHLYRFWGDVFHDGADIEGAVPGKLAGVRA